MSDLTIYLTGLGIGLSLIIAIGAQNAFVLRQGLRGSHVFPVVLTCALSDAILIVVGVTSFAKIAAWLPMVDPVMRYGGAAFLVWYGARNMRAAFTSSQALWIDGAAPREPLRPVLLTALALTWLNPHVYLDTVVLLGTISTQYAGQQFAFAAMTYASIEPRPPRAAPISSTSSWRAIRSGASPAGPRPGPARGAAGRDHLGARRRRPWRCGADERDRARAAGADLAALASLRAAVPRALGNTPVTLTIFRGHEQVLGETVAHWKGRVVGAEVEGQRILLQAESIFSTLRRAGVRAKYQRLCRHALYGRGCGLDIALHWLTGTVTAVSGGGAAVTIPEAAGSPMAGIAAACCALACSLASSPAMPGATDPLAPDAGTGAALATPEIDPDTGDRCPVLLDIAPGCDLRAATCAAKFGNLSTSGAFPRSPAATRFGGGSIV
jgi:L-lysine exporter family protein LysE/ArgO